MQGDNLDDELVTGINVTPMVDITLVLLVIFMVTASFVTEAGMKVALPKSASAEVLPSPSLAVTLAADGGMTLGKEKVDETGLKAALDQEVRSNPGVRVTLAADRNLPYGQVVHVLDLMKEAGVTRAALASER